MEPPRHPEAWIEALAWVSLSVAFASAAVILFDVFVWGHRQKMAIMDVVYPVTALYGGPVALWFYIRYGRCDSKGLRHRPEEEAGRRTPRWVSLFKAVSHCGAGCTLGDIAAEWLVASLGLTVAGTSLFADMPMDFAWAWTLGIAFQYFTIAPMRDIGTFRAIWAAVKADTLSILAFQAGLFGGMALYQLVIFEPGLPKSTATYWMMMQLSMILGFLTALPVNELLLRTGLKEPM